MHGLNSNNIYP